MSYSVPSAGNHAGIPRKPEMIFIIGAPRSGTTLLERMLSSHSQVLGGPEPHLITPLAHLGVWAKVDKAPYDPILSAEAQNEVRPHLLTFLTHRPEFHRG
ncbi:MAG TPA: sulfotransferase, partial [Candidatus Hydrogenedentes bacterium]|nr:sulfotransferase [Candidatus Hydrogenedentota bacterium]